MHRAMFAQRLGVTDVATGFGEFVCFRIFFPPPNKVSRKVAFSSRKVRRRDTLGVLFAGIHVLY
jgi:hypothetical protein